MTLQEELNAYVKNAFSTSWTRRDGQKVPETDDLALKNEAVDLDASVLYADLAASTAMVKGHKDWFAADVYKNYLYCASRIIRANGGVITAYDGDRVMAVFIGTNKNSSAAKTALQIKYAVDKIINPAIAAQFKTTAYRVAQKVGVDTSKVMVARTGIRGSNDLVWVGNAPNNAAKMAGLDLGYSSYVTAGVHDNLHQSSKYGGDPKQSMWTNLGSNALGYQIYGSNWHWGV